MLWSSGINVPRDYLQGKQYLCIYSYKTKVANLDYLGLGVGKEQDPIKQCSGSKSFSWNRMPLIPPVQHSCLFPPFIIMQRDLQFESWKEQRLGKQNKTKQQQEQNTAVRLDKKPEINQLRILPSITQLSGAIWSL